MRGSLDFYLFIVIHLKVEVGGLGNLIMRYYKLPLCTFCDTYRTGLCHPCSEHGRIFKLFASVFLCRLTGLGASRHLRQLESGFFVLRDGGTLIEPSEFALPLIYSSSTLKYLLAYAQGELLLLMLTSRPSVSLDALTAVQQSVAPLTLELLPKLAEECQAHGGELGHLAGWRYNQESKLSARASPRTKISAMSHHARAVATAVSDSLSRLRDSSSDGNVEVCARSSQGVWVVADMEGGREQRQVVVVREKKVDADPSRAIASIDASLQSLSLV